MNTRTPKILIGQVNSNLTKTLGLHLTPDRFLIQTASTGDQILDLMKNSLPPDLLILDLSLQKPDAIQICRTVKATPDLMMIPIIIIAPYKDPVIQKTAVEAGCDDILEEPVSSSLLMTRIASLLRLKFLIDELAGAGSVLQTLARAIEAKDQYTLGHADRVAGYAVELGRKLSVSADDLVTLKTGGMLHDIGKIAIPDAILTKPGKYDPEEFQIMKKHPVLGCEICGKLASVSDALPIIRHHHERLDGSGYPDALSGDKIPYLVRIVTIVDIYDALRSKRSYKDAFPIDKTFEIMWEEVDKGWWDKSILTSWEKTVRSKNVDII